MTIFHAKKSKVRFAAEIERTNAIIRESQSSRSTLKSPLHAACRSMSPLKSDITRPHLKKQLSKGILLSRKTSLLTCHTSPTCPDLSLSRCHIHAKRTDEARSFWICFQSKSSSLWFPPFPKTLTKDIYIIYDIYIYDYIYIYMSVVCSDIFRIVIPLFVCMFANLIFQCPDLE